MSIPRILLLVLLGSYGLAAWVQQPDSKQPLRVPAFAAYFSPDPDAGPRRDKDGRLRGWKAGTGLAWSGRIEAAGLLEMSLVLAGPVPEGAKLSWTLSSQAEPTKTWSGRRKLAANAPAATLALGEARIGKPGYVRLLLECQDSAVSALPDLEAVLLSGPAALGANFTTVERRNAASVHLGYEVPREARDEIEWFTIELTPRTDPLYTYYMATGFDRGYFGMQVNSPSERRVIFSVWDAGQEAKDRAKVAADDRVHLIAKGPEVVANDFGNEGTGGHSHRIVPWKLGGSFRFLLRAVPDAEAKTTTTTAWFFLPDEQRWTLIASFCAPRDGRFLHGLYSFNENFSGSNGDQRRLCEFHNAWVRTRGGDWITLERARFTHDGHGEHLRLDRSGGVLGDRFYLANGGFVDDPLPGAVTKAYAELVRERGTDKPPSDAELAALVR